MRSDEAYSLVLCNLLVTAINLLIQSGLAAAREKERLKKEKQKEVSAQDRQVDTISTSVLFLPQFPLWQCTNTDSCTSSESASEIRLSWPSFIEYSGQPLDRSWTPGQPKLNPRMSTPNTILPVSKATAANTAPVSKAYRTLSRLTSRDCL